MKKRHFYIFTSIIIVFFVFFSLLFTQQTTQILGVQDSQLVITDFTTQTTSEEKIVFLTFDDGPAPITRDFLKVLKESDVQATFFVTGENVETYPSILKEIHEDGHAIGNHTNTHPFTLFLSRQALAKEILIAEEKIYQVIGIRPQIIRAPYALYSKNFLEAADLLQLTFIGWDVDPEDWKNRDKDIITQGVMEEVSSGSIILLHDGPDNLDRANTLEALKLIIIKLREQNYQFKLVSDFI